MNTPAASCRIVWNGTLVSAAEAGISPLSDGFMYGLGLFETIRVLGGRPVFFQDHFDRLRRGAAELGLPLAATAAELRARCLQCAAANQLADGGLKIAVFQDTGRVSELILPRAADYPAGLYRSGFRLKTIPDGRENKISGLKTLNYLKCLLAKRAARAAGCDEALFVAAGGALLEGSTSNVFVVKDGTVLTPALAQGILPGIARAQVLHRLKTDGASEAVVPVSLLAAADEVFITNSLLGVMPVASVDGHNYDLDRNPVTRSLMASYRALEAQSVAAG